MTFLNKYKINIFLGFSILIFLSIFSISSVNKGNQNKLELPKLPTTKLHEVQSSNPNLSKNKILKTKIDILDASITEWITYAVSGKTLLTYYIQEGILEGHIQGKYRYIRAHSGGGALASPEYAEIMDKNIIDNVCFISKKVAYESRDIIGNYERGGPIVPGIYTLDAEIGGTNNMMDGRVSENRYVELYPDSVTRLRIAQVGRMGGFRIHFRGGIGSDGCIVMQNYDDFIRILSQIEKSHGGTLVVKKAKGEVLNCGNTIIDKI